MLADIAADFITGQNVDQGLCLIAVFLAFANGDNICIRLRAFGISLFRGQKQIGDLGVQRIVAVDDRKVHVVLV